MGSGCGSVGRAVASDTRGPRFKSSHWQNYIEHLFTVNCIEKTKIRKKRPGMAHLKNVAQRQRKHLTRHRRKGTLRSLYLVTPANLST